MQCNSVSALLYSTLERSEEGANPKGVLEANTLETVLAAHDCDLPANRLTFTLVSGPTGLRLDSATGP